MTTDLSAANGWIPEPIDSQVILKVRSTSAVEAAARLVRMTSETVSVPRFDAQGVDVVAEHAVIPVLDATLDDVTLKAVKFANRFAVSVEDTRDGIADAINQFKLAWASNFAVKLDNAALGAAAGPFQSVYTVATTGKATTAGALSYEDLVAAVGSLEVGPYGDDLVVIAHPAFKMELRNLKDADGNRVVATEGVLGSAVPTVFGHNLVFSNGAVASATASDRPTGNPLLIVGSKRNMILGARDGVESQLSTEARWETDEVELKMRARRGFAVADGTAFRVIEKTA